jgi:RNase P protein component
MNRSLEMLRSPLDFGAMQSDSRSRVHPLIVLRYRRNQLDRTRYGISTGRRLGSALLVVARPPAATATKTELHDALDRLLRAGGLTEGRESPT